MFLDTYKLRNLVFQLRFAAAFEVWDRSGAISRKLNGIWPGLEVVRGEPQLIVLRAPGIIAQTEIRTALLTFKRLKTLDEKTTHQIRDAVSIWRSELGIRTFERVSARVQYWKEFPSLEKANAALLSLQLVRWPCQKVFGQQQDSEKNNVAVIYRFEDASGFTVLRVSTEKVTYSQDLDPDFFDEDSMTKEKNYILVDFDRGLFGPIEASNFIAEEWLKGYFHVLRRDIDKVLGDSQ